MSGAGERVILVLRGIAEAISAHKDYLTELDSAIGDADHGINLDRGFAAVVFRLPELADKSAGEILKAAGMTLVSTVGGASGPLYGTAFMYAGECAGDRQMLTVPDGASILRAALDGIIRRGKAEPGDKTMVDALTPAVAYLESPEALKIPACEAVRRAVERAKDGMESTRDLVARKGRASFLKERSAGHLDPGAVSCYLMLRVVAEHILSEV